MKRDREKLYYSISEVSEAASVKAHVLRYWESQFKMLRPKKNRAGNRMYRPRDLNLVLTIRDLLYNNGYTIAGARRKLIEAKRSGDLENGTLSANAETVGASVAGSGATATQAPESDGQLTLVDAARSRALREVRDELKSLLSLLDGR